MTDYERWLELHQQQHPKCNTVAPHRHVDGGQMPDSVRNLLAAPGSDHDEGGSQ